ncbi:MAG TPA: hypothetical protein VMV92_11325 [Streptosporangiaceae bacterium]|nr:hypothetical protein [Streptosporangiaceae bacterium]
MRTEVRKLTSSKPVHAAAGAGVLASAALRELPARIARWRTEVPGLASGYVTTARAKAVQEYDKLAVQGEQVLHGKTALNGKGSTGKKS